MNYESFVNDCVKYVCREWYLPNDGRWFRKGTTVYGPHGIRVCRYSYSMWRVSINGRVLPSFSRVPDLYYGAVLRARRLARRLDKLKRENPQRYRLALKGKR